MNDNQQNNCLSKQDTAGHDLDIKSYEILNSLIVHSEQTRWTRLNTLLIVDSILLVAWATIFASTPYFPFKPLLLTGVCIPAIIFGFLWAPLGFRSSRYLDAFHKRAYTIEEVLPESEKQPFHLSETIRQEVKRGIKKYTSSRSIVTWLPLVFSILFIILAASSWFINLEVTAKNVTSAAIYSNSSNGISNNTVSVLIPLISALLGGLAGAGISIFYAKRQSKQEYCSLILSFCTEMVSLFNRCIGYYKQSQTGEVSYSALFSFTDASALSKFASVCENPEVVASIIELKFMYFQIQRHVEEASRFALQGTRSSDPTEKEELMKKAIHAQGTALAFFTSSYDQIENHTDLIVQTAQQVSPGSMATELSSRFDKAKKDKKALDVAIANKSMEGDAK